MITISIDNDEDDDDDDDDDNDGYGDDDGYGDFFCAVICVYISVHLIHITKCVNIPCIHCSYNGYFPVSQSKSRQEIGQNNWARS